jgi:hypothetical protein
VTPFYAARARVGRRGAALLFFALLDVIYGHSLTQLTPAEVYDSETYRYLSSLLPMTGWAVVWVSVGIVCAVQAPRRSDRLAFAAASALKVVWGSLQLLGWMVGEIPRGWVVATIWLAFAAFVQVIAGWDESSRREE